MTWYVCPLGAWTKEHSFHTIDVALLAAEGLSLREAPGTVGVRKPYMVWRTVESQWTKGNFYDKQIAVAVRGRAFYSQRCPAWSPSISNDSCEKRACKECNGIGWVSTGQDRG